MVLTAKGIESVINYLSKFLNKLNYYFVFERHEVIDVNLRDKPEWLLERNPFGKVPTIEFGADDKVLYESLIINDYLDEVYPGPQLRSNDIYRRALDKVFIETISPLIGVWGKVYSSEDVKVLLESAKESLRKAEDVLKKYKTGKFLSGLI